VKVIVLKYLLRKGFTGMALWPFVLVRSNSQKADPIFLNHEKIHLRQQIEMLLLPFFLWYILEYLIRLIQYRNRNIAYRNISFEREAYANEKDLQFLNRRSFWNFLKYL